MSKIDLNIEAADEVDLDAFGTGEDLDDDKLDALLSAKIKEAFGEDEGDGEAFGPSGTAAPKLRESVSIEDGAELLEEATRPGGRRGSQAFDGDEGKLDTPNDPGEGDPPAAGGTDPAADPSVKPLAAGADGLDLSPIFRGREAELAAQGITPQVAVQRLVDLNTYALQNPADHIAWLATQHKGQDPEKLIADAAAKLGLKVSRADEDPFEDEDTKKLREENRRLKGYTEIQGPEASLTPARVQSELTTFLAETNEDGTPKRPHFERLNAVITERIRQVVATEKRPATTADLARVYDQVTGELGLSTPAPAKGPTPAAQGGRAVPSNPPKNDAARTDKARAASMSIDATGQGADRRPALAPDASLDSTIRHYLRGSV